MSNNPSESIARNSQTILEVFRFVQQQAESTHNPDAPVIMVEAAYWRAHQQLYDIIKHLVDQNPRVCRMCHKVDAHPLSEFSFCTACHTAHTSVELPPA